MRRSATMGATTMVAGLMAVAILAGSAAPARACGGFFCNAPPVNPLDPLPVAQAGENVVFGVEGDPADGNAVVTAHIQILYSGTAAQFSWVVPVLAVPELSTGTDFLFSTLATATQPRFVPEYAQQGTCLADPFAHDPRGGVDFTPTAGGSGGSTGAGGPGVSVLFQGAVGPYDARVLQSSDAAELKDWLVTNGYYLDPRAGQIIDTYVQEGKYFVALKLLNGQDVKSIRPIVLTFHGTDPCVPLRLTAIAALPDMPVTIYMLGRARAVPLGFLELKLDELRIDWPSQGSNYASLLSQAADEAGGNAFVTEYAGTATVAAGVLWTPDRFSPAVLRAAATPAAFVQALIAQGLANDAQTLPLLSRYIPMPAAAVSAGVTPAMFYANLTMYAALYPLPPYDLAALADAVVSDIIEPRRLAQQMIDAHPYLTRLGTFLSPEEMNQDPLFAFNGDLTDVAASHTATLRTMCGDRQYMLCNAPVRLELPDGRMAWLKAGVQSPICQYAPYDQTLAQLPASEIVWQRGPSGEGTRRLDNGDAIHTALVAHNSAFDQENRRFPLPIASGGAIVGGGTPRDSGCGCGVAESRSSGAGALTAGALALVALGARRRRRYSAGPTPVRYGPDGVTPVTISWVQEPSNGVVAK